MPGTLDNIDKFLDSISSWVNKIQPQYINLNLGTEQVAYDFLEGLFLRVNVPGISLNRENYQFYYKVYPELGEVSDKIIIILIYKTLLWEYYTLLYEHFLKYL